MCTYLVHYKTVSKEAIHLYFFPSLLLSPVPPGPPTNLQVTGQTTTTLSISWTNPTFNGFSDIASFRVQVTERGSTFPYTFNGDDDTTTFTLTGLLPFTNYTVRLFVRNAVGLEGQPAKTAGMTDSMRKPSLSPSPSFSPSPPSSE